MGTSTVHQTGNNKYLLIKHTDRENTVLADKMYSVRKVTGIITFQ